ncbi:MAG: FG-GAP-like repeat-containing protein, partial [Mariprofundales bacterium]
PADLYSATSQLKSLLGLTAFTQLGGKNPLNDPNFKADGTGMDAVMDALDLQERDEDGDGKSDLVLTNRSASAGAVVKLLAANPLALLRDIYSFSLSGAALLGDDLYGTAFTESDVITSPYNSAPLITSGTITPQTALGYSREALNRIVPTLLAGAEAQGVDLYASRTQLVQYVERVLTNLQPSQNAGLNYDDQLQGKLIQNDHYSFVGVVDSYGVITNPILAADTLTARSVVGNNSAPAFTVGTSLALTAAEDSYASFTASAFDPEGGAISYDIYTVAANGSAAINTTSGVTSYIGNLNYSGADSFIVRATDPYGAYALLNVNVTVTATVNHAPVITNTVPFGFNTAVSYSTGVLARAVASGDFNGDGKPDMVVANQVSHTIFVYLNNGDGSFGSAVSYLSAAAGVVSSPMSVTTADLNADNYTDVIVGNFSSNNIGVLLGTGTGAFATAVNYTTGTSTNPAGVATGDFNGDGKLDVATANLTSSDVSILLGDGFGAFASPVKVAAGTPGFNTGDFNGDGKMDLLVTDGSSSSVKLLLNNGVGGAVSFAAPVISTTLIPAGGFVTGEFNGDGNTDLVVFTGTVNAAFPINVMLGSASGTFSSAGKYTTIAHGAFTVPGVTSVAVADYNGDGNMDFAVSHWSNASSPIVLFFGDGAGGFTKDTTTYPVTGTSQQIITADFNGDGNADLAVANRGQGIPSNVSVLLNQGHVLPLTGAEDSSLNTTISASDVDVGTTLIYSIYSQATHGTATIHATTGAVTFTPYANYNGSDYFTVQVADGNGGTDTMRVNVTLTPVNDPPVAGLRTAQAALSFDGVNDYVNVGGNANLRFVGVNTFSLEAWVNPTTSTGVSRMIVSKANQGVVREYSLAITASGTLNFYRASTGANLGSTAVLSAGQFSHVAATYDGTNMRIYINGVAEGVLASGSMNGQNTAVLIGAQKTQGVLSDFFDGVIDDVRIWNTARTQAQIVADRYTTLTGNETGLVG